MKKKKHVATQWSFQRIRIIAYPLPRNMSEIKLENQLSNRETGFYNFTPTPLDDLLLRHLPSVPLENKTGSGKPEKRLYEQQEGVI